MRNKAKMKGDIKMDNYEKAFKDLVAWIIKQDKVIEDGDKFGVKEGNELIPGVKQAHKMIKRAINDVSEHYSLDVKV